MKTSARTWRFAKARLGSALGHFLSSRVRRLSELHRDQRGTISVLSVFTLLVFTFLLVMMVNVASHLDDKIKMQNSADASAHTAGVILARGMNGIAFTNHLLCDVFAITAYLREGRDKQSAPLASEVLDKWDSIADRFSNSQFKKFATLGSALKDKIPKERKLVDAFSNMTEAASSFVLPVFESVLKEEQIPKFQHNLVLTIPGLAERATEEVAKRNGLRRQDLLTYPNVQPSNQNSRPDQTGVPWRMNDPNDGAAFDENDPNKRTLPAVDPSPSGNDYSSLNNPTSYLNTALEQRRELSKHYLEQWTRDKLYVFDTDAELSQFSRLWRIFTCGQLDKLLTLEYPTKNLPMVLRATQSGVDLVTMRKQGMQQEVNQELDRNFHYVAVVYRKPMKENGPGIFKNPLSAKQDAVAFAEVSLFVPRPRWFLVSGTPAPPSQGLGGTFGFTTGVQSPDQTQTQQTPVSPATWGRENWPTHWDLLNQNWTVRLVPATASPIPAILQTQPPQSVGQQFKTPNLGPATIQDINQINTH